jgi:hypothetical protein
VAFAASDDQVRPSVLGSRMFNPLTAACQRVFRLPPGAIFDNGTASHAVNIAISLDL